MRSNTKSLAVMLLLGCTSAHQHHRNQQRLSSQFSENYDHQNMLQLYSHMAEFDYSDDYADNDIIDFVQVDTKSDSTASKPAKKAQKPDEKAIINQLKKQTPAEIQQEKEREKQIKQEEQAFAQPFLELGQSTEEYQQKQHQKKKEIKNLLKQAVEGKIAMPSQPAAKPAATVTKVQNAKNQIKLFQEDKVINEDQDKIEKVAVEKQQPVAATPKPAAMPIQQAGVTVTAPRETQAVPSIANTNDLFEQSKKLLSASENLDNGKAVIVPQPLSNPKQIAQDIIKKHQMEMQAVAQKQKKQENEKDEFSQNLYEMSKQLLNSANEIEKETERSNAIKMQKEAEEQVIAQRAYEMKMEAERKLKKQQKKEKKTKAMRDLENASEVTGIKSEQKIEVVAQKKVKKEEQTPEQERIASPTDPDIMKAAEAAAAAIVENEKAMKQKEEDSQPKTVLDEISNMVVKRTEEVEKGPEQAKVQQLAIAQEQTRYTPLNPTLMQSLLRPNFQLNTEQKKAMAAAEETSHSFLDRLNKVQTSPFAALNTNPFDQNIEKSKSEEQDMHNQLIKMQDASLQMSGADVNL